MCKWLLCDIIFKEKVSSLFSTANSWVISNVRLTFMDLSDENRSSNAHFESVSFWSPEHSHLHSFHKHTAMYICTVQIHCIAHFQYSCHPIWQHQVVYWALLKSIKFYGICLSIVLFWSGVTAWKTIGSTKWPLFATSKIKAGGGTLATPAMAGVKFHISKPGHAPAKILISTSPLCRPAKCDTVGLLISKFYSTFCLLLIH